MRNNPFNHSAFAGGPLGSSAAQQLGSLRQLYGGHIDPPKNLPAFDPQPLATTTSAPVPTDVTTTSVPAPTDAIPTDIGGGIGGFPFNNVNEFMDRWRGGFGGMPRDYRHEMKDAWRTAKHDWRGGRPMLDEGETQEQFMQQMMDWRGDRPNRRSFFEQYMQDHPYNGTGTVAQPAPGTPAPAPAPAPVVPTPTPAPEPAPLTPQQFYQMFGYYPGG